LGKWDWGESFAYRMICMVRSMNVMIRLVYLDF
jgi:hypothetical protein